MKNCPKCKEIKKDDDFRKNPSAKSGLTSYCRACEKKYYDEKRDDILFYHKKHYIKNKEKIINCVKEYREKNKEKISQQKKKYNQKPTTRESCRVYYKKYYAKNIEKERIRSKEKARRNVVVMSERAIIWRKNNPVKWKTIIKRRNSKILNTHRGRLNGRIRSGIYSSLSKGSKNRRRWEDLVGYNIEQLKNNIESKFKDGMSWDNMGQWHIDHIIPISAFNFEKPEDIDFKKCWSLKNLRPMWARDNLLKHNKLEKPFQPSLAMAIN